jgi:hypothetical protein
MISLSRTLSLSLVLAAIGAVRSPPVAARACWECEDIGMYPCLACVSPHIPGFNSCDPTCNGFCYVSSQDYDCGVGKTDQQLLALATRTSGGALGTSTGGVWTDEEVLLGQARRTCRGYIVARYYPPADINRLREASRRIVI